MMSHRVCLIVLDSVGIGALPDAAHFGDEGAHTLGNIHRIRPLNLPNLFQMGLGNIRNSRLPLAEPTPTAAYCRLRERTHAKDTTCGHWEMAGLPLKSPFLTYPDGFPPQFISKLERSFGTSILGNKAISGTVVIQEFGEEHIRTGYPIVYTSADSVLQIAAHENVISPEELYELCSKAATLTQELRIGRVIARPFDGEPGTFQRTAGRRDFVVSPPQDTILDQLSKNNIPVHAIGKIEDIFDGHGITSCNHTTNNHDGIEATIQALETQENGLIFTNLVDFDMLYGHRNDVMGYAKALEYFDQQLPRIQSKLREGDLLLITADHGCDPTMPGTDHTREHIPCLIYGSDVRAIDIGTRETFADIGATILNSFGFAPWWCGTSFLKEITHS